MPQPERNVESERGCQDLFSSLRGVDRKDHFVDNFVRKIHNVLLFTLIAINLLIKVIIFQFVIKLP